MEVLKSIALEMGNLLFSLFSSDDAKMRKENDDLLLTDEDRRKYREAIDRLKDRKSMSETIILSNDKEIKLVCQ